MLRMLIPTTMQLVPTITEKIIITKGLFGTSNNDEENGNDENG